MTDPVKHVAPEPEQEWLIIGDPATAPIYVEQVVAPESETYIEEQDMCRREAEAFNAGVKAALETAQKYADTCSLYTRPWVAANNIVEHISHLEKPLPPATESPCKAETALAHIRAYASEAARTPITRESILADQPIDAPIPDDLKVEYESYTHQRRAGRTSAYINTADAIALFERIAHLEAQLQAQTQKALALRDESTGLIRLILQPETYRFASDTCGAISREDGLRKNAVCVKSKGHKDYHGTTTEDVMESKGGYFWYDSAPQVSEVKEGE